MVSPSSPENPVQSIVMDSTAPIDESNVVEKTQTAAQTDSTSSASSSSPQYSVWSAWIVVLGAVCLTMPTYGLMSAFGLFQVYWEEHQLKDFRGGNNDDAISWISSVLGFLNCFFGLLSGILLDRASSSPSSVRMSLLLVPSSIVYWVSFLAMVWCSTYGQFMACMVVAGIASALPSTAAFVVVDHIFEVSPSLKHSAAATGVVSTGAPLGGLLFSLMLRALLAHTAPSTWPVSMFWLSSVIGAMELLGCVLVVWGSRLPATEEKKEKKEKGPAAASDHDHNHNCNHDQRNPSLDSPIEITVTVAKTTTTEEAGKNESPRNCVNDIHAPDSQNTPLPSPTPWYSQTALWAADSGSLSHFADRGFWLFTICVFVYEFVLYTQWGSLPYFAARTGLGDVFYFQMVYNMGAIPGRTIPSWLASRFGPFNVTLAMTALTVLTVFVVWVPFGDHSAVALYFVAFLMGVGTGSFVPLAATCLSRLCNGRGFGMWLGSCYALVSVASLIGNPVNQALLEKTSPRFSVVFQGILLVVSFFFCFLVRRGDQKKKSATTADTNTG